MPGLHWIPECCIDVVRVFRLGKTVNLEQLLQNENWKYPKTDWITNRRDLFFVSTTEVIMAILKAYLFYQLAQKLVLCKVISVIWPNLEYMAVIKPLWVE